MTARRRITSPPGPVWLAALLLALPCAVMAQSGPASSSSAPTPDMGSVPAMDHDHMADMDHGAMPGMDPSPTPAAQHDTPTDRSRRTHGAKHGPGGGGTSGASPAPAVTMGAMQGGRPPPDARSPDYSEGVAAGPGEGHRHGSAWVGMLRVDQLEAFHGRAVNGQGWAVEGWYGSDVNKLWVRTEGERSRGKRGDGDLEVLWDHGVAAFWSTRLGMRRDLGEGSQHTWAAFGVQGLAPYWFELGATGYVGASGRTAVRLRADYELLFTQRLILQPEAEINLYGKNDPQRRIGRGLSDVQFGLRLRYEIRRQFAPYIGVNWIRRMGTTAGYARQDRQPVLDRQVVAGVRLWF